jgi:hypothetical protein
MSNKVKIIYVDIDMLYKIAKDSLLNDNANFNMTDYKFVVFGKNARLQTISSINESLKHINESYDKLCIGRCPQLTSSSNMLNELSINRDLNTQLSLSPNVNMPLAMQIAYHVDFVLSKMYSDFSYAIVLDKSDTDELNNLFAYQVKTTILYE